MVIGGYIPIKLCVFPQKDLVLVAEYGFGKKSNAAAYKPGNTGNIPEEKAVYCCYKSLSYEVEDRRIFTF